MTRTTRVKGIHRVTKKLSGSRRVRYHYAWRGGPRFWSSDDDTTEGGADYWAAYHAAVASRDPSRGTFRQVIRAFLDSREFAKKAPRTQADLRESIQHPKDGIDAKFGSAPIKAFDRPEIRRIAYQWCDGIASDRTADKRLGHLRLIVRFAIDRAFVHHNHLTDMKSRYSVDRSEIIWTDDEIAVFEREAPAFAVAILVTATETGLRPEDQVILNRAHIHPTPQGRRIVMRTAKRGKTVSIPVTPRFGTLLDGLPKDQLQVIVGGRGKPFTHQNYLGAAVRKHRNAINEAHEKKGLPPPIRRELRLYDARGTAATRLLSAGATLKEISAHMGWSLEYTSRMIEIYCAVNPDAEEADALLRKLHTGP